MKINDEDQFEERAKEKTIKSDPMTLEEMQKLVKNMLDLERNNLNRINHEIDRRSLKSRARRFFQNLLGAGTCLALASSLAHAEENRQTTPNIAPHSCLLLKYSEQMQIVAVWAQRTDGTCWAKDGPTELFLPVKPQQPMHPLETKP